MCRHISNAFCCLYISQRERQSLEHELPDRDERADSQDRIDYCLEQVTTPFLGAHQKPVGGLVLVFRFTDSLFVHAANLERCHLAAMTMVTTFLPDCFGSENRNRANQLKSDRMLRREMSCGSTGASAPP